MYRSGFQFKESTAVNPAVNELRVHDGFTFSAHYGPPKIAHARRSRKDPSYSLGIRVSSSPPCYLPRCRCWQHLDRFYRGPQVEDGERSWPFRGHMVYSVHRHPHLLIQNVPNFFNSLLYNWFRIFELIARGQHSRSASRDRPSYSQVWLRPSRRLWPWHCARNATR